MKMIMKSVSLMMLSTLAACSWLGDDDDDMFRDRANDYRKARVEEPLTVPEHLQARTIEDTYDIPRITDNASLTGEFDIPRPETLGSEVLVDAVRINKLGDQQWILIDGAPGEVWPRLRSFLSRNNLPVARADAVNGLIETAWLQPTGENMLRERIRLRLEQGVQRETTEVYVLQADIRAGEEGWPAMSSSSEREALIVNSLSQYLADNQVAMSSVSMLAQQAMGSSGKVSLEEDDQRRPYIQLELPFARAWASLGLAIEKAGFAVDDLDRTQRIYYVRFSEVEDDEDDEPGFWAGLFADEEDEGEAGRGPVFLVRINEQATEEVHILVERNGDAAVVTEKATAILKRIKKHLS
jgi:outer membrane protein assembly factor BamC